MSNQILQVAPGASQFSQSRFGWQELLGIPGSSLLRHAERLPDNDRPSQFSKWYFPTDPFG
jgi:hypothetical protein